MYGAFILIMDKVDKVARAIYKSGKHGEFRLLVSPTGPHGETLQVTQGLGGQLRVLTGRLDAAWQWKGRRGRLLWESMHCTSRCLHPAAAPQPSGH